MSETIRCRECGAHVKAENETAHMRKVHPNARFEPRTQEKSRERRSPLYLTSRTKKAIFAVLVVVVFLVAGTMLLQSSQKGRPIDTTATAVYVSMSGFDPTTITVKAGTPLKIDLINRDNQYHTDGGGWHNFAMEAFAMNITVEPLGQKVFSVPTGTPGSYTWYCDICCGGKDNPSMVGTIRIVS